MDLKLNHGKSRHDVSYLLKVFDHLNNLKNFNQSNKIHGDLTLDNIIFNKKLFIIDWELYHSKNLPGYDITYLFLSAACLPYIIGKSFLKR